MEKRALLHAARLFEKNAGRLDPVIDGAKKYWTAGKNKLSEGYNYAKNLYNSPEVQNTIEGLDGAAYDAIGKAGHHLREGMFGRGIGSGYNKLKSSVSGEAVDQALFNEGLKEMAKGVARTGAVYGGGAYAGSKLLDGNDAPQQPYYYE